VSKYDDLLDEVKRKAAAAFQSIAKKYVPRMYEALRSEDPHMSPQDARERIEKDCIGFWSKRTILEVLPAEAKNPEKQKAGRLSQKKRNFAAVSAAPAVNEIILDTQGRSTGEDFVANTSSTTDDLSPRDKDIDNNKESSNLSLSQNDVKSVNHNNVVKFEYLVPFEQVRLIIDKISQQNNEFRKLFFHGSIDINTGKIISAFLGELSLH
jgi:hypothetical protein